MTLKPTIVIVDDEDSIRFVLKNALDHLPASLHLFSSGTKALEFLQSNAVDLCIFDVRLPDITGLDLLDHLRKMNSPAAVIVMTAYHSMKTIIEATRKGAFDYIAKPFEIEVMVTLVEKAIQRLRREQILSNRPAGSRPISSPEERIIGNCPEIQELFKQIGRISNSSESVLITGESGTGKELFAQTIHQFSPRAKRPFVPVNLAAIPATLLERELFGHEAGAFTGALSSAVGKIEAAEGGTLFLDEIAEIPRDVQAKLLRLLQEQTFERLGSTRSRRANTRIVAATHRDPKDLREDLYYRLAVIQIHLPPLHSRGNDIELLTHFFLERSQKEYGGTEKRLASDCTKAFLNYRWPGNVRELENAIRRAYLLSPRDILTLDDFPFLTSRVLPTNEGGNLNLETFFRGYLKDHIPNYLLRFGETRDDLYEQILPQLEKPLLQIVLEHTHGNQIRAAKILGINRNTLKKKIDSLGLRLKTWTEESEDSEESIDE